MVRLGDRSPIIPTQNFKLNVDAEYQDLNYVDNNPNIPAIGYNAAPIPISRYLADPEHHGQQPRSLHASVRRLRLEIRHQRGLEHRQSIRL